MSDQNEFIEIKTRDIDGRLLNKQSPDGSMTKWIRLSDGRVEKRVSPTDTVAWSWLGRTLRPTYVQRNDLNGHVQRESYEWDGSRLESAINSGVVSGSLLYSFDENWRKSSLVVNGVSVPFIYDQDGLITRAGDLSIDRNAQTGRVRATNLGQMQNIPLFEGPRLIELTANMSGNVMLRFEYTYDALSRIKSIRETDKDGNAVTVEYSYDDIGQLIDVVKDGIRVESFMWDAQNNRIGGIYNGRDQIVSYGSTTYEWDENGSIANQNGLVGTRTFKYDSRSNLLQVFLEDGTDIRYDIDAYDRRIGKSVNGVSVEGFLYKDQLNPVAWLNGDGTTKAIFVYADRKNVPSYMIMNGQKYKFIVDHLGSVRMVVNAESGAILQELKYDVFGNELVNTNEGFQPFGYAGGITDIHTGLVKFGARDYDPSIGRWTTIDPIRFGGGQGNLYAYVGNDPVNKNDPSGLGPAGGQSSCMTKFDKCFVNGKNVNLDETCVLECCDYNYNMCQTLNQFKIGKYFGDADPSKYCDANGQIAPFDQTMDDSEGEGPDNYGKTDADEFEKRKNNQPEVCVAKTGAGECEACFAKQGQSDRVHECMGF